MRERLNGRIHRVAARVRKLRPRYECDIVAGPRPSAPMQGSTKNPFTTVPEYGVAEFLSGNKSDATSLVASFWCP